MSDKLLELMVGEMVAAAAKNGELADITGLVKLSDAKLKKALEAHKPIVISRLAKARADLVARIAELDMVLAEIGGK